MAARTSGLRLDTCLSQVLEAANDEHCRVVYPEGFFPPTRKDGFILQEDRIVLLTLEREPQSCTKTCQAARSDGEALADVD